MYSGEPGCRAELFIPIDLQEGHRISIPTNNHRKQNLDQIY